MKGIRMLLLKLMLKFLRKAQLLSVVCIKSHGCNISLIAIRQSVKDSQPGGREPTLKITNLKLKMKNHDFSSPPTIIGKV